MIDIKLAKKKFDEYVNNYDASNPKIKIKIDHTYRTAEIAKKIAQSLNLDEENVKLAELIGILHDVARFEQIRIYDSFYDEKTFDHADYGVKILFEDGLIKNFLEDRQYDDIIYKAVKNHNKYKIEDGLSEKELLHAKIIRDADKTDIFYVELKDLEDKDNVLFNSKELTSEKINEDAYKIFAKHELIPTKYMLNEKDEILRLICFIYDYNYKLGLEIIRKNHYVERTINTININNDEQLEKVQKIALEYLDNEIKNRKE